MEFLSAQKTALNKPNNILNTLKKETILTSSLNSNKIHKFYHYFSDGQVGYFEINLIGEIPIFGGNPLKLKGVISEYVRWASYLADKIIKLTSQKQKAAFSKNLLTFS